MEHRRLIVVIPRVDVGALRLQPLYRRDGIALRRIVRWCLFTGIPHVDVGLLCL